MSEYTLKRDDLELLLRFFPVESDEQKRISFNQLKGYLSALALSPATITPEKWWEAVKALPGLSFDDKSQEVELCKILIRIDEKIKHVISTQAYPVPGYQSLASIPYGDSVVEQWCLGFMDGILVCENLWFSIEDSGVLEQIRLAFGVISLIANREHMSKEIEADDFENRVDDAQKILPQIMAQLDEIRASGVYAHFKEQEAQHTLH